MEDYEIAEIRRRIKSFTKNMDYFTEFVRLNKMLRTKYRSCENKIKRIITPFEFSDLEKQHLVNNFNMMCFYQWKINLSLLNLRKHYRNIELDDFILNLLIIYSDNINKFRLKTIKLLDTKGFMLRSIHDYDKKKAKGLFGDHLIGLLADDNFEAEIEKRIQMVEEEEKESDIKVNTDKVYHVYDVDEGDEINDNKVEEVNDKPASELSDSILNEINNLFDKENPSQVKQKGDDDVTDLGVAFHHSECEAERVSAIEKCEMPSHDDHEKSIEEVNKMEEEMNKVDDESYSFEK